MGSNCGSPGEVENMPSYGHLYRFPSERLDLGINHNNEIDFPHNNNAGKHMVWLNVVLKSKDSLRQKIAWALSQILVISESGLNEKTMKLRIGLSTTTFLSAMLLVIIGMF